MYRSFRSAGKYLKVVGAMGHGTKVERGNLPGGMPRARRVSMSAKPATRSTSEWFAAIDYKVVLLFKRLQILRVLFR
jgi:hypothetical protein